MEYFVFIKIGLQRQTKKILLCYFRHQNTNIEKAKFKSYKHCVYIWRKKKETGKILTVTLSDSIAGDFFYSFLAYQ